MGSYTLTLQARTHTHVNNTKKAIKTHQKTTKMISNSNKLFIVASALLIGILVMGQDLAEIPADLTFSCEGRPYGYYADPATNCQVFHICLGDGDIKWSFLCPNQTIFNQQYFVCDYAINVECNTAENFYSLNDNF